MKVVVLEPYYGGSHKIFLDGLLAHLPFDCTLLTLPARKWKWRMRLAAPFIADKIIPLLKETGVDLFFCSSFMDVATLRALLPASASHIPFYTYFHENQFAYPVRRKDERDFHFGLTNLTTVMASDRVAFNSGYNMRTFMAGVTDILKICPDMRLDGIIEKIAAKSIILYPGIDFSHIDMAEQQETRESHIPVIVWNHRWEHDKNPAYFFRTLFDLDAEGFPFRLIILGQSFRRKPAVFAEACEKMRHRVMHCGYVESRTEYARLLTRGDIVVSTAKHEFFGMSVLEAVRAGCRPVLPDRLSFPELFPTRFLYEKGDLYNKLKDVLVDAGRINRAEMKALTHGFSWSDLREKYCAWFKGASCPSFSGKH